MITVEQALEILREYAPKPESESVALPEAVGRYLAKDIVAKTAMPAFNASNMDGYSARSGQRGGILTVIGKSSAGRPFKGRMAESEAVRIFTGAVLPDSADRVIIQEDVKRTGDRIELRRSTRSGKHVRGTGSDFSEGHRLLEKGQKIGAADLSLAAGAGLSHLAVRKLMKVAIIETGDELERAGTELTKGQILAANGIGISALVRDWGGTVIRSLIAKDDPATIKTAISHCEDAYIIVMIGGASVGEYDLARDSARRSGFDLHYSDLALRPGKPGWFATKGQQCLLGLPGNPASAFVGAHLFLRPLLGLENSLTPVALTHDIEENGPRETWLRARLSVENGQLTGTAFPDQDSYRLIPQSRANALIRVPPMAGPYEAGDHLDAIRLRGGPDLW